MKKLLLFCLLLFISAESIQTAAQESKETKKEQGIFNSVAVGLGVGITFGNICQQLLQRDILCGIGYRLSF